MTQLWLCVAHQQWIKRLCCHCDSEVDSSSTRGLSCRHGEGRLPRHASINAILHWTLTTASIPSRLEPSGLSLLDGTCPDGMTITPWHSSQPLVWDVTSPDTLAISYRSRASVDVGLVEKKSEKFIHLSNHYHFVPFAIETFGAMGPAATAFFKGRRRQGRTNLAHISYKDFQWLYKEEMPLQCWGQFLSHLYHLFNYSFIIIFTPKKIKLIIQMTWKSIWLFGTFIHWVCMCDLIHK